MPLFNFSSHLNNSALSILFEQHFVQGTVGRKQITLPRTQETRHKYFVVLNANPNESETLTILSQTDPQYALKHHILKTHLIKVTPEECDGIFRHECYIDCTEIILLNREKILSEFITDPSILVGLLPDKILQRITSIIVGSPLIAIEYQERIYKP